MPSTILVPLGHTEDSKFAYFNRGTGRVQFLSAAMHRESHLLGAATSDRWFLDTKKWDPNNTTGSRQSGRGRNLNWEKLAGALMEQCRQAGFYDPKQVRGRGLWQASDGRRIYNTGRELFIYSGGDVVRKEIGDWIPTERDPFRFVTSSEQSLAPSQTELSALEGQQLAEALSLFNFERGSNDARLLLGWIGCTCVMNLLQFRPQIALTAARGAGKSTLLNLIVRAIGRTTASTSKLMHLVRPGYDKR